MTELEELKESIAEKVISMRPIAKDKALEDALLENHQLTKKLAEAEKFIPDGAAYAFYNDQCKEG